MPRVKTVVKARESANVRRCHRCSTEIRKGDSYSWWKFRTGGRGGRKVFACAKPECRPKASDLTQSPHLSAFYAAQESASEEIASWEVGEVAIGEEPDGSELDSILETYAEALREVGEGLEESATNIEDGFGHETYQSEELKERAESYESAADEAESFSAGDFGFSEPDLSDEDGDFEEDPELSEEENDELRDKAKERAKEDREREYAEAVEEWAEEVRAAADDAVQSSECY